MARITGKRGELWIPTGDGISLSNQALTKNATKTIQGVAYANRFYGTSSRTAWNRSKGMSARLQGIVGEASITPGTANDTVDVSAFTFYRDNGAAVSVAAQTVTLSRAAAGAQWHMLVTSVTGGVSAVAGKVSASTSAFVDTWDAVAGPAYISTDETLIGAVKLTPGSAGPVAAGDITYSLASGTLIQERSDIPGFAILPMEGGVLLNEALLGCHTAGAARTVYASFYNQYPLVTKIGDVDTWSLSGSSNTVSMEAMGDYAAETDFSGPVTWSGSFSRFYVGDARAWDTAMERRTAIVRLYPDSESSSVYYEGAIIISSWGVSVGVGAAVKENISFNGDGNLELRGI